MAIDNFSQVEQALNLINAALAPSIWSKASIDKDVTPAANAPNAIAIKDLGNGDFEFHLSTQVSGVWTWLMIATTVKEEEKPSTIVIEDVTDLDEIDDPIEGTLAIVKDTITLYVYIDDEWVQLTGRETKDYIIVSTLDDRDEIENPHEGLLVYVTTLKTEYRYVDDSWIIKDFQPNNTVANVAKSWYVSPDGDDVTGDGSEGNPWKSIEKALLSMPSIHKKTQSLNLLAGDNEEYTYTIDHNINKIFEKLTILSAFRFYGEMELITNEYVATAGNWKPNNPIALYLDDDKEFDEDNQYMGYFFGRDASTWYPIGPHKKDEVVFSQFATGKFGMTHGIWKTKTKIIIDEMLPSSITGVNINFFYAKVHLNRGNQNAVTSRTQFQRCVVTLKNNDTLLSQSNKIHFSNSFLIVNNTNNSALRIDDLGIMEISNLMIYNQNNASRAAAIEFENSKKSIDSIVIENFAYAYTILGNSSLHHSYGYHVPVVNNCGALFQIKGSGFQWNKASNEANGFPYPRMYLNDVNYLFALNAGVETILNNINVNLGDNYLQNELNVFQSFVTSDSREWQGGQNLSNVALSSIPKNLIDHERNLNIVYPGSFGNIETMEVTVQPDDYVTIPVAKTTVNKSIKIEYTATRGQDTQVGTLYLTTDKKFNTEDNTYYIYNENVFDDVGIEFAKEPEIYTDDQLINLGIYADDRDENTIEVQMNITRVQKDPSGWFYIPHL